MRILHGTYLLHLRFPQKFQNFKIWTSRSISRIYEDYVTTTIFTLKPWTNGVASRRKLKTWGYLRLRLARACVHLRWLAMTCAHFGRHQICTQVKARFSPFGHPTQVNASWVTSINILLANKMEDSLPKMSFFATCVYLRRNLRAVWSPNASLYTSSTCVHLRLLPGPFDRGFTFCERRTGN